MAFANKNKRMSLTKTTPCQIEDVSRGESATVAAGQGGSLGS